MDKTPREGRPVPRRAPRAPPLPPGRRDGLVRLLCRSARSPLPTRCTTCAGKVLINNRQATTKSDILPGDRIVDRQRRALRLRDGRQDAILLRSRSELTIERYDESQGC
jgi:hypothetical protein